MSVTYATPLTLEVRPSRRLQRFLFLSHGLALLSLLLLDVPLWLRLVLCGLLVAFYWRIGGRQAPFRRITWYEQGWSIETADRAVPAELLDSSFVTHWLTILNFRCRDGSRVSSLLLADSVDAEVFRRLRVRLKVDGAGRRSVLE